MESTLSGALLSSLAGQTQEQMAAKTVFVLLARYYEWPTNEISLALNLSQRSVFNIVKRTFDPTLLAAVKQQLLYRQQQAP